MHDAVPYEGTLQLVVWSTAGRPLGLVAFTGRLHLEPGEVPRLDMNTDALDALETELRRARMGAPKDGRKA